jgi:uncharacterized protein with GYD domain
MPMYLLRGSYSNEGYRGLASEGGTGRRRAAEEALGSVGGRLEAFYFALGNDDFFIIAELPDNPTTVAVTMAGKLSGSFGINATVLLTPEELDVAASKAVDFRPPEA